MLVQSNVLYLHAPRLQAPAAALVAAKACAERAISALEGAGIFGVEMFLLPDGSVLLNEVAPRPHNRCGACLVR